MPAGLTSRWGWYWVRGFPDPGRAPKCKTQNSGLRSKEEKPRDPINEPSRCNTQEGLLSAAQPGDSDLLGGRAHRTANLASFYRQKPHYQHITHGLQSDWLQHHPYHMSTQVIRGTQMFVLTRSCKNHKLFCNSYGKSRKLFVQFSETSHRLLRHHPSLSCKFHKGRGWVGGGFPWPFHSLLFLCH